jgi:hypothetical protein
MDRIRNEIFKKKYIYRVRWVIRTGSQFHKIGYIKLETMFSSKNAVVLNWRIYTQSHETTFAHKSFHVALCAISNLKQQHFSMKT